MANRRFEELDSLRGFAALSVVLFHGTMLLGITAAVPVLYDTPLEILVAGHQAVIFFFLLSGFVLSLPYFTTGPMQRYRTFLIRRIARLYPPYLTAIAFGLIMRLLFYRFPIYQLWTGPIGWHTILQHVFMIDQFSQEPYDPVIWSLVMEMRIALVFPLLLWFVGKVHWRWSLIAGFCLSVCGITLHAAWCESYLLSLTGPLRRNLSSCQPKSILGHLPQR